MDDNRPLTPNRHSGLDVSRANFRVVRRGFDQDEVQSYLERIAREMSLLEKQVRDLQAKLSEATYRAENPILDESRLTAMLGAQSTAILRAAHDEGAKVTAEAQERATQLFTQAQERATKYLVDAQARALQIVNESEVASAAKEEEARAAAMRLEESARINGDAIIERSREQGRAIVEQANQARRQVLNDLVLRRKALNVQIEQLRAARDSLTTTVNSVRDSVDQVLGGLMTSDEGARAAAHEIMRNKAAAADPTEEELLRGVPLREVPDIQPVTPDDLHTRPVGGTPPSPPASPSEGATVRPRIVPDLPTEPATELPDNDVVSDIFARLRASTQDEKGREPQAKRPPKVRTTPVTADDELFLRREEAIALQLAELIRHVKRAMQDDQNVMIERLRGVKGLITDQLEDELLQRSRYSAAALDAVRAIAQSGVDFAHSVAGGGSSIEHFGDVDECAADLAVTLSVALRKRITADGNDDGAERASTAFREWRGARIERLCGDIARRAFNVGVVAACQGSMVRVLVAPDHPPCDACAGDAVVGGVAAGRDFPSGQPHPPLHAGCNCAVVPADG
ncbi:MAG: DivIVA domain-containing protein [Acidobacteria bacterium]|nr:DivIVA domain-containing protein [Acidobacteriota bacterium]